MLMFANAVSLANWPPSDHGRTGPWRNRSEVRAGPNIPGSEKPSERFRLNAWSDAGGWAATEKQTAITPVATATARLIM